MQRKTVNLPQIQNALLPLTVENLHNFFLLTFFKFYDRQTVARKACIRPGYINILCLPINKYHGNRVYLHCLSARKPVSSYIKPGKLAIYDILVLHQLKTLPILYSCQ